ncbi:MAG TPA: hypothetical protein VHK64_08475 [Nocardioidaceae bacterium]|jgi:hypothetical protein|nr:hypothetical protein [Nocardioidaceae bacterium]
MPFHLHEQVTILPPYNRDPVIVEMQHYGVVVARTDAGYMVELSATSPPNQRFGPFPPERLARGWKDGNGRWRAS